VHRSHDAGHEALTTSAAPKLWLASYASDGRSGASNGRDACEQWPMRRLSGYQDRVGKLGVVSIDVNADVNATICIWMFACRCWMQYPSRRTRRAASMVLHICNCLQNSEPPADEILLLHLEVVRLSSDIRVSMTYGCRTQDAAIEHTEASHRLSPPGQLQQRSKIGRSFVAAHLASD